jgi:hypothetical protein
MHGTDGSVCANPNCARNKIPKQNFKRIPPPDIGNSTAPDYGVRIRVRRFGSSDAAEAALAGNLLHFVTPYDVMLTWITSATS